MKNPVLAKTYTQGLINTLKNEDEFESILRRLFSFKNILLSHKSLGAVLSSPFLPLTKKLGIVKEILAKSAFETKASRFILLLVENGRLPILDDILALMPEVWNESKGVSTFEVCSAIPLTSLQKKRLEEKLIKIEGRPVFLKYKEEPSLIGGLFLKKGNIVYDVSLKGQLQKLREIICEG